MSQGVPSTSLIALDVDGTILTSDHQVTQDTREAVSEAVASGIAILLASSRPPHALLPIQRKLGLENGRDFIAYQGALLGSRRRAHELTILGENPMPAAPARRVLELADDLNATVNWFIGDQWLVQKIDDHVDREATITGGIPQEAELGTASSAHKLMMICDDPARLDTLHRRLPPEVSGHRSHPTYLEVTHCGVDKSEALIRLCRQREIPLNTTAAIGDGLNDLGLFRTVGTAIAMGNAPAIVQAKATWTTTSNDSGGVARAIHRLLAAR